MKRQDDVLYMIFSFTLLTLIISVGAIILIDNNNTQIIQRLDSLEMFLYDKKQQQEADFSNLSK